MRNIHPGLPAVQELSSETLREWLQAAGHTGDSLSALRDLYIQNGMAPEKASQMVLQNLLNRYAGAFQNGTDGVTAQAIAEAAERDRLERTLAGENVRYNGTAEALVEAALQLPQDTEARNLADQATIARQTEILEKLDELEAAKKKGSAIQTSEQLLEFTRTVGRLEQELEALEQGKLSDRLSSEDLGRLSEAVRNGQADLTAFNRNDKITSQTGYHETADRVQFERYKERLGDDAPREFKDFQALKYGDPAGYDALVGLYSYKGSVPEVTKADYNAYQAVKATGVVGTVRVPPETIEVGKLVFNDVHGTRHGCTLDDVKSYVETAKCTVRRNRWDGASINFYSLDGAAYISADTTKIKTAFSEKDFDPTTRAIAEVFK